MQDNTRITDKGIGKLASVFSPGKMSTFTVNYLEIKQDEVETMDEQYTDKEKYKREILKAWKYRNRSPDHKSVNGLIFQN